METAELDSSDFDNFFDLVPEELKRIALLVHEESKEVKVSVREIISWWGAKRRSVNTNYIIKAALEDVKLDTFPDFEYVYIDSDVEFLPIKDVATGTGENLVPKYIEPSKDTPLSTEVPTLIFGAIKDPTFRIGQLKSANKIPISVNPNAPLTEATTLMMLHDFSQLPVMQNERDIKGVISWESVGRNIALSRSTTIVRDCMVTYYAEVPADASLLSSIDIIASYGYVLVRQPDRRISGIVTTSDLSLQFRQLAEPFLLIGEIENYIRRLIDGKFTAEQLKTLQDPSDSYEINKVSDLTFGQYVRLLEKPEYWANLNTTIDRGIFIKFLDRVRELRNDIMHFEPDPFAEEDIQILRSFVNFMRNF